ncbi:MAG: hypothetical protein ACXAC5_03535 [Promethearchaeota archaeon]
MLFATHLPPTIPCEVSDWWSDAIHFEEFKDGFYETLTTYQLGVGVTFSSPECVEVRTLDSKLNPPEFFGEVAIYGGDVLTISFDAPVEYIVLYIGSDNCDEEIPGLWCFEERGRFITGDCIDSPSSGCTQFGPEILCPERAPFQWYFGVVDPEPFLNYTPHPIKWCELRSEGRSDLFIGTMQIQPWPTKPPRHLREK